MLEFAAVTYGLLATFVLSALGRNHRERRPHPTFLRNFGYLLCGVSGGTAAILAFIALRMLIKG